jgi:rare lipoprotein A
MPALVNGRQFYRVRLGPVASVDQADALLARLASTGRKESLIVVE